MELKPDTPAAPVLQLAPNRTARSLADFARELRDVAQWLEDGKYGDVRALDIVICTEQGHMSIRSITPPTDEGTIAATWGRILAALVRDIME